MQFRHLRQRNLLLHLPPFRKEILDLLRHCLLPRPNGQKQNHFRTRRRQQLPGSRRCCRFLPRQPLRQAVCVVFQILPRRHQIFARNRLPQIGNVFVAQPLRQEIQHRRSHIRRVAEIIHLLPRLHQRAQAGSINLGRAPVRIQHLQPALFFIRLQHAQRIVFIRDLLDLVPDPVVADVLDIIIFFSRLEASLCSLFERPMKPRREPRRPDHPRRLFQKRVIVQHPYNFCFDIGSAVKWIHQQPARPFVHRQGHRVHRKIPPPQILNNRRWRHHRSLPRLVIPLRPRHRNFGAHSARQRQQQRLGL